MKKNRKKAPLVASRPRLVGRKGEDGFTAIHIGKKRQRLGDMYVYLLAVSEKRFIATIIAYYFLINLFFATCYYLISDQIQNARPNSFLDMFFFSVQTLATIGYGRMSPVGIMANILVTFEAFFGFGFVAVTTGLIFARFSRPTANLLFSDVAVITSHDGVPHLMLRVANQRGNSIVNANATLVMLKMDSSAEGIKMRRFHDLKLVRDKSPLLQLTWTIMHAIDENSPLYGLSHEALLTGEVEIIVTITGLDETLSQTVHARYSYLPDEILYNVVFEDIIKRSVDSNRVEINYHLFHSTKPLG